MHQILEQIEADVHSRPSAIEFEMAYQARVAMDRIRFAIKHTEQFAPRTDAMRTVGFQLLDALQRLQAVDRRFQARSRRSSQAETGNRTTSLDTHQNSADAPRNGGSRTYERQAHV
jgi:hypothetical protein